MLLAELEVWHSRPVTPTRRVSLGHLVLPVDPTPGFGGLLLGAVIAAHLPDVDDDLVPDVHRLLDQVSRGERVVQPRLKHRYQVDRHGLAVSVHRLEGEGDNVRFSLNPQGSPLAQVLGAIYAVERLTLEARRALNPSLHKAMRWRGADRSVVHRQPRRIGRVDVGDDGRPEGVGAGAARLSDGHRQGHQEGSDGPVPLASSRGASGLRRRRRRCRARDRTARRSAPDPARMNLLLFPGAGSSSTHSSLLAIEAAVAPMRCVRADFAYRKAGRKAPDRPPVLLQTVRDEAKPLLKGGLVLGGRSMGGRICSMVVGDAEDPLPARGLVLISYPLHPPGKPDSLRVEHLPRLTVPCLFIHGTRDPFATPDELAAVDGDDSGRCHAPLDRRQGSRSEGCRRDDRDDRRRLDLSSPLARPAG